MATYTDAERKTIDQILTALDEQFMRPEILGPMDAWEVCPADGETCVIPYGGLADYLAATDSDASAAPRSGVYLARLSATGYMDATDWSIHDSEDDARAYLADAYGDNVEIPEDGEEQS